MKLLFIVVDSRRESEVLYYCHNILELFRLKEVFVELLSPVEVYRYSVSGNYTPDKHFNWDEDTLKWEPSTNGTGVGFEKITYESLEMNWTIVKNMQDNRSLTNR